MLPASKNEVRVEDESTRQKTRRRRIVLIRVFWFQWKMRRDLDMQAYYMGQWIQWKRGYRAKFASKATNLVK
ncbi:hypothetical protein NKT34_19400 [Paenibacillus polysaccharolyticus]|uniref:hypothetical protein n=1 Tax=Paenibacillus polysaccharolyticus TaxID=582692 RepID=UPI0020A11645|nr:hypothetical protein [Paenibacillus polysaccharolyticus]MCP1135466.1 hypothetical protein [Paenibacillus polysaccharolyticus]